MSDLTERYKLIKAISERLKEQPNKPKRIKSSTSSKQNNRIRRIAKWCLVKWSTKTGHRVRVFSSIDFPIRLVVTHHYIRAVLVRCNIQRYSPLLRELHR